MRYHYMSAAVVATALLFAGCGRAPENASGASSGLTAPGVPVELPAVAVGAYRGTFILAVGGVAKSSHAQATCTVSRVGDRYSVRFSGGIPAIESGAPGLDNLRFGATPGSQVGVFQSLGTDGSVEGVAISTYMTNLNIDTSSAQGQLVFTGMK